MAKLTGRIYKERYREFRRETNSFYEEQPQDEGIGNEYLTGDPEVVYYIDKKTEELSAKETRLIW